MRPTFRLAALAGLTTLLGAGMLLPSPATAGNYVDLTLINRDTGERLNPIRHGGKLYVAGTPGQRYAIELKGRHERVLTVVSVDGVNILTGQTAAPLQSGYVLDPNRRYAINGWRKSLDEVAQFVFTALPDSYAARTGRPDHVGVIGVATFRERPQPVAMAPRFEAESDMTAERRRNDSSQGSGPAAPAMESVAKSVAKSAGMASRTLGEESSRDQVEAKRLGTGHGERERSVITTTEFVRAADTPDEMLTIYYDSRANLIARGIIRAPRLAEPLPFPGGFVPDPKG